MDGSTRAWNYYTKNDTHHEGETCLETWRFFDNSVQNTETPPSLPITVKKIQS